MTQQHSLKKHTQTVSFPRQARLLNKAAYGEVFKRSTRFTNRYWQILVHQHRRSTPRMGLAIAKKKAKHAVTRNRIKRIARESFRHNQDSLQGIDVVVMNRDAAATASAAELRAALDMLWTKVAGAGRNH